MLTTAIEKLMAIDPGERYPIFNYLCSVAIADRKLERMEIDFLMDIATSLLGMHEIEASRLFVNALKEEGFYPRL